MRKITITAEDYHYMWDKIHSLEAENNRLKGYIKGLKEQLRIHDVVQQSEKCIGCKEQICYKSNEPCKYDCSGLCKESC